MTGIRRSFFYFEVNAATLEQPCQLARFSIDIMSFKHSFARCFSQPRNCLGGGIEARLHRGSQGINIASRHQPTVLAGARPIREFRPRMC